MNKFKKREKQTKKLIKAGVLGTFALVFLAIVYILKKAPLPIDDYEQSVGSKAANHGYGYSRNLLNENAECRDVHQVEDVTQRCAFVSATDSCKEDDGFIQYVDVVYCKFPSNLLPLGVTVLFVWWLFIFIGLATTADDFFCPDLAVISDTLRLSPNVAGVTFLAFGNGAPDIFSAIAAFSSSSGGDAGLAIGGLFGAGVFVTTIVAGTIAIICPFVAMQRPLLRDLIFYLAALFWTFVIFYRGKMFLWEAIGYIMLYFIYVIVVILSQTTFTKQKDSRRKSMMSTVEMRGHRPSIQLEKTADGTSVVSLPDSNASVAHVEDGVDTYGVGSLRLVISPLEIDPSSLDGQVNPTKNTIAVTEGNDNPAFNNNNEDIESKTIDVNGNMKQRRSGSVEKQQNGSIKTADKTSELNDQETVFTIEDKVDPIPRANDEDIVQEVQKDPNADLKNNVSLNKLRRQSSQVSFKMNGDETVDTRRYSLAIESSEIAELEKIRKRAEEEGEKVENPLGEFLAKINPINTEDWSEMKWYAKIYECFKAPIMFLLIISVPVVNFEEERNNWNRHLVCLNCFIGPTWAIVGFQVYSTVLGGVFPLFGVTLIVGFALAALVYFTSKNERPPVYHNAFGFLGFIVAIVWIYVMANEIVNLLKMFGVVFNISDAILGLTLLAWGNSVGDFIADTVMARIGRPRTGFAACFGGPLFNLLLGVGIPFTIKIGGKGSVPLVYSLQQVILTAGLGASLVSSFVSIPLIFKFKINRAYGLYLVLLYVSFLVVAILAEVGVIKGKLKFI
ncbi:unnamed protein product [Owenia fusiformis]|uniref:Sodium/calcium exchanger membrane region domain-containing protein n=1 Tax=Owenia fusiformis TaxID=6347 RepID=A0A8S4Q535_OWEFU|nr:unnamed protein product [Owenia fusiformis]